MSDKIEPALGAEEWADLEEPVALNDKAALSNKEGNAIDDIDHPEKLIAVANAALPHSDRRKIKGLWTRWLREEADVLRRNGAGAGALMADEIAAALESYLPPEEDEATKLVRERMRQALDRGK